jgi:hypothetical protein
MTAARQTTRPTGLQRSSVPGLSLREDRTEAAHGPMTHSAPAAPAKPSRWLRRLVG